jgi:uncharacterized cupin superfamily protein
MKVVHTSELPWNKAFERGAYSTRRKDLGGDRIASGLWELAPGKKSAPLHAHLATEEALYVISGRAQIRTPDGLTPIAPGDYVSFPAGGPAHQLINDGDEPLVYLAMSAGIGADVVEYPDSGKVAAMVGRFPNARRFIYAGPQADYFDGDKDA